MTRAAISILSLLALSACGPSKLFHRLSDPQGYWLPLTVDLRLDTSVTEAQLQYTDACRKPQTLPIGDRLKDSLRREIGTVFERVTVGPGSSQRSPDGVVRVALGLQEVALSIYRQATKSYPATVTLGATIDYVDSTGTVLYTKNLKTDARGTVETKDQQCDVRGLAALANQAAATLAQGLKKQLGTSTKIREAALVVEEQRGGPVPLGGRASATAGESAVLPGKPPVSSAGPASLVSRVMLTDENQDQRLQSGETISLEVEVRNTGGVAAQNVTIGLSGTPSLVEQFAKPATVGQVQPGETKHIAIEGTVPETESIAEAELIISVEALLPTSDLPNQKKFQLALEPKPSVKEAREVDVDLIPERASGYERQKAVGIAVGVGTFRNGDVPTVEFAARDAEVMAEYFQAVAGISPTQIRLATDDHALKDDLVELFEEWLPEQVAPGSVVFIFLAGRAWVNPATGGVSLIPHEADPSSVARLFSLRRLYDALARLPIQRVVLLMDLALIEPSPNGALNGKAPLWDAVPPALREDKLVQVVGVSGRQEAHQYEEGRHGLFTYFLLKGLGGAADQDRNGIIAVGELCGYVHEQVVRTAKEQFHNLQEPACLPPLGSQTKTSHFALGRVK